MASLLGVVGVLAPPISGVLLTYPLKGDVKSVALQMADILNLLFFYMVYLGLALSAFRKIL